MNARSAILVGAGGQGAIPTERVMANGLMETGYGVKMPEVYGMSQRGDSVSTKVHWGKTAYSPAIGKGAADLMAAFEKMETVRYADFLRLDGVAVINAYRMESVATAAGLCEYPEGCLKAMTKALAMTDIDWERVIRSTVPAKSLELNLRAYHAGLAAVEGQAISC